mgnify:CR=1 FL=1
MRAPIILLLMLGMFFAQMPTVTHSQGAGSLFIQSDTDTSETAVPIEEIMRQAAENGVGVVVIARDGNL